MTFEFDVCFSFAGEQRLYVEQVATLLRQRDIRIFYDDFNQADLWGKDLYVHLDEVYRKKARFCVVFASADYARKAWTNHERRSAQARALESNVEYVLPARFDDTEIPGVPPTIGYVDLRVTGPEELADLIARKLGQPAAEQPAGWEWVHFDHVIQQGMATHRDKRVDHELGYVRLVRVIDDDKAAKAYLLECAARADEILRNIVKVLDTPAQAWAFGRGGNRDNITHLGRLLVDGYAAMLDWAADLRGTRTSDRMRPVFELAGRYLDAPINQFEVFAGDIGRALAERRPVLLLLRLSPDDRVVEELEAALGKV